MSVMNIKASNVAEWYSTQPI